VTNDRRSCFLHGVRVATELHVYFEQVLKSNKSDRPNTNLRNHFFLVYDFLQRVFPVVYGLVTIYTFFFPSR
jgi:hypothetical protein